MKQVSRRQSFAGIAAFPVFLIATARAGPLERKLLKEPLDPGFRLARAKKFANHKKIKWRDNSTLESAQAFFDRTPVVTGRDTQGGIINQVSGFEALDNIAMQEQDAGRYGVASAIVDCARVTKSATASSGQVREAESLLQEFRPPSKTSAELSRNRALKELALAAGAVSIAAAAASFFLFKLVQYKREYDLEKVKDLPPPKAKPPEQPPALSG